MIKKYWPILLIWLLGAVLYSNTLHSTFQFDDIPFIVNNKPIQNLGNVKEIWNLLSQPSRFVAFYSFALNYHFHKLDAFAYHLTNLLIHLITATLVWWFVKMLMETLNRKRTSGVRKSEPPRFGGGSSIPLFAALIFVAHPVQTQAVTYITQRFASLATLFYLLAVCLYVSGRMRQISGIRHQPSEKVKILTPDSGRLVAKRRRSVFYFFGAAVAAVLGMFSKEIVITLPLMILLIEGLFFYDAQSKKKHVNKILISVVLVFLLIIPAVFSFNISDALFASRMSESHIGDTITFGKYVMTQFRVMVTFLRLAVFPMGQNIDYDFPLSQSFFEWPTLLSFLLVMGSLLFAVKIKARRLLIAFGIFWFFLALAPNFIPRRHVIFEHKLYLPMVGFSLVLSVGFFQYVRDVKKFVVGMSIFLIILSYLTYQRNKVWQTPITLWEDALKKSPNRLRPKINLGSAYLEYDRYDDAIDHFTQVIEMDGQYTMAYNHRGNAYRHKKQYDLALADLNKAMSLDSSIAEIYNDRGVVYEALDKDDLALDDYNKALEFNGSYVKTYNNRGIVYQKKGNHGLALKDFNKALAIDPDFEEAYSNRSNLYEETGQYDLILEDYKKALSINPRFTEAYYNRGVIYEKKGEYDLALLDYNKAIQIDSQYVMAYNNRGVIYKMRGQYEDALNDFDKALEIDPTYMESYSNRCVLFESTKQYDLALANCDKALEIDPNASEIYNNRGVVYKSKGMLDKALQDYTKAVELNPQYAMAYNNRGVIYKMQKQYDLALEEFNKAVDIDPNNYVTYLNKGNIYGERGEFDLAIEEFTQFLKINPTIGMGYFARSLAYKSKGDNEKALEDALMAQSLGYQVNQRYFDEVTPNK